METILIIIPFFLIGILLITIINAFLGPTLKKRLEIKEEPLTSILVPARNEEKNIGKCLTALLSQDYSNFKIIVLDDQSTDRTKNIVQNFKESDERVQLVNGENLPEGWTGKNWACHQLSKHAKGEYLIFTDADNWHASNAISNTIGWMQKYKLGLFSAFPQQITGTISEKLVIPFIEFFVYGVLTLWLTYYSRFSSISAANGQWIAFTQKSYKTIGGHEAVKNHVVEDVELARLAKKKGKKIITASGTGMIFCRMYYSAKQVWRGFSKNLFGMMGYKIVLFFLIYSCVIFFFLLPFFLLFYSEFLFIAILGIMLNFLIRLILAISYKHNILYSVFLYPLGIILTMLIGLNSIIQIKTGVITWKGRKIRFS